jgi:hypothetical protein
MIAIVGGLALTKLKKAECRPKIRKSVFGIE